MRIVIQRVKRASVSVEEKVVGSIQKGFLVLIGVGQGDDEATASASCGRSPLCSTASSAGCGDEPCGG